MAGRLRSALVGFLLVLALSACVGVVDRDGSGLDSPPGGWDNHGPG